MALTDIITTSCKKDLVRICIELSQEKVFNYRVHEVKMVEGLIYFAVYYESVKQNKIGSKVLIEKEVEVKDWNTFEIKNRLRAKANNKSDEKIKIIKNAK